MERLVRELSAHIHATEARLACLVAAGSPASAAMRLFTTPTECLFCPIAQIGPDQVIRTRRERWLILEPDSTD